MARPSNPIGNGGEDEANALASQEELEAFDLTADFFEQDAQSSEVSHDELQSSAASLSSHRLDPDDRQRSTPSRSSLVEDSQNSDSGVAAKEEERRERFRFGRAPNTFGVRQDDGEEALHPCFACVCYANKRPNVLKEPLCIITGEGKCRRCRQKHEACNVNGIHPPRKNEADRKWLQILYSERVRIAVSEDNWPPNPTFTHHLFDPSEFEDSSAQVREAARKYDANRKGPKDPIRRPAISKAAEEALEKAVKNVIHVDKLKRQIIRLAEWNEEILRKYPYFDEKCRIIPGAPPHVEQAPWGGKDPKMTAAMNEMIEVLDEYVGEPVNTGSRSTRWVVPENVVKESRKTYNVDRARARHPTETRSGSSRNREDDRDGSMVPKKVRPYPSRQGLPLDRQRRPREEVIISSSEDEDSEQDSDHAESSRPKPRPVRRSPPAPKRRRRSESEPRDREEKDRKGKRRQRDRF